MVNLEETDSWTASQQSGTAFNESSEVLSSLNLSRWAAATDGLLQSLPAFVAFSNVDPEVLRAIEFSTAEHVRNLASVDSYVQHHFFDQPLSSAEGWLHRLEGYVAEQKTAAALEQAGHHVEFAQVPNQPGWDLLVDGHPWQVKEGVSAAAQTKEFLAHHEGIEVITSPDAAAHISDPNVHSLPELDHDLIASSTKHSLHGVKDGFHAGFHFPLITFALSTYREFSLLYHQKTQIEKVLKHIAVDVAAVGGAGFVGMKAGGLIGSIFSPIGAAIGATIFGICGAIFGKMGANAVRFSSFDQAKAEYFSTVETAKSVIQTSIETSQSEVRYLQFQFQGSYESRRFQIVKQVQEQFSNLRSTLEDEFVDVTSRFPKRLDELSDQLRAEEREMLQAIPSSRFSRIFPNNFDLLRTLIRRWFRKARAKVRQQKHQYLKLEKRDTNNLIVEIKRFSRDYEFELDTLANDIQTVVETHGRTLKEATDIEASAIEEMRNVRSRLIKDFSGGVGKIYQEVGLVIRHWKQCVERCKLALIREAKPVGMDEKLTSMFRSG